MLIHKMLKRFTGDSEAPLEVKPSKQVTKNSTVLKCFEQTTFGVKLVQEVYVQYTSQAELKEKAQMLLGIKGITLVRNHSVEYRLNNYGELVIGDMWGQAR